VTTKSTELTVKLQKLKDIWTCSSTSRKKNAPHKYIAAIYEFYRDLRNKRVATKTANRISKLAKLNSRSDRHPVRALIDASCTADEKTKSRMTRAIRYAQRQKWDGDIKSKLQENGGIAGCAKKFAGLNKKSRYKVRSLH
jgi:hypothetical protein